MCATFCVTVSSILNVCYLVLPLSFDTLCSLTCCVSFFFLCFFKFLVFETAIYANKDAYIIDALTRTKTLLFKASFNDIQ